MNETFFNSSQWNVSRLLISPLILTCAQRRSFPPYAKITRKEKPIDGYIQCRYVCREKQETRTSISFRCLTVELILFFNAIFSDLLNLHLDCLFPFFYFCMLRPHSPICSVYLRSYLLKIHLNLSVKYTM